MFPFIKKKNFKRNWQTNPTKTNHLNNLLYVYKYFIIAWFIFAILVYTSTHISEVLVAGTFTGTINKFSE